MSLPARVIALPPRTRALVLLLPASLLFAAGVGGFLLRTGGPVRPGWGTLMLPAALGAPLMGVLLELVSGVSFWELSRKWDALQGWQRGVLGLLVVAAAFGALVFGIVGAFRLGLLG
jgi:hypothetical protein